MNLIKDKIYFPPLTGIRAIAVYMVFIFHLNPFDEENYGRFLREYTSKFYVGVTLFFVLSGFLITFRYYNNKAFRFKQYFYNRLARIYPLFFIIVTCTLLIRAYTQPYDSIGQFLSIYLLNITFLKGFFKDFFFSGLLQGWSLTVEETFYLAAPFIFIAIKKSKASLLILPIFFIATGLSMVALFSKVDFYGLFGSYRLLFSGTFFGRCVEFFVGVFLALLVKENRLIKVSLPLTYIGIACVMFCIHLIPIKNRQTINIVGIWDLISANLLLPASIFVFFYGLLTEKSLVSKILGSKIFVLLGKSSYAFYLIHIGYLSTLIRLFISNRLLVFILINITAILLYLFLEEPLHRYFRNKVGKSN